jgi:ParB-like chromosome segregation protein Spo0J
MRNAMDNKFAKKTVRPVPLANLKPHPRQSVFAAHTSAQVTALADDLQRNGLICPVEITPEGVIICGCGRVAAAKSLGWTQIHCWVRTDLAEAGEDAIIRRLIEDNLNRRQLTKLGLGRAFLALKDAAKASSDQGQPPGDFRDYLGDQLGYDGTTAERWARLAVLPPAYDTLVDSGLLTQQQAERIVELSEEHQQAIAAQLVDILGQQCSRKEKKLHAKQIISEHIPSPRRAKPERGWLDKLCKDLSRSLEALPPPVAKLVSAKAPQEKLAEVLDTWQPRLPRPKRRCEMNLDEQSRQTLCKGAIALLQLLAEAEHD